MAVLASDLFVNKLNILHRASSSYKIKMELYWIIEGTYVAGKVIAPSSRGYLNWRDKTSTFHQQCNHWGEEPHPPISCLAGTRPSRRLTMHSSAKCTQDFSTSPSDQASDPVELV